MNEFKNEPEVTEFFALASRCAWALIDPLKNPAPNMDFSSELPANMSPQALLDTYSCLWYLQTQEGLRFKASYPQTPVSEMHILLESLFEEHRAEAFASVLNRPNDSDNKMMAQTHMTKAYLTYVTS